MVSGLSLFVTHSFSLAISFLATMSLFSLKFHNMEMKKINPILIISCRIIKITLIKCGKYQC